MAAVSFRRLAETLCRLEPGEPLPAGVEIPRGSFRIGCAQGPVRSIGGLSVPDKIPALSDEELEWLASDGEIPSGFIAELTWHTSRD